ncbi:MAG: linear amide C-N hydrolase [Prevotellaceae bacterium]|nr:linear amide C-N hydrolase [Prevotellaceae bacterium]
MKNRLFLFLFALLLGCGNAFSCSRVVFLGQDSLTLVGRTLDWRTPIPTNLYVYPRGMEKKGMPSGNTYQWKSKYGSVLAVSYDGGVTEGMNEKGLIMNALFCKGSVYRTSADGKLRSMSLAVFVSYFLDNFETVDEVYQWLQENEFGIYGETFDEGTTAALHWAITDRSGNTLVMEFQHGKLDVFVSRDYRVLTNDPPFEQIQAINNYWKQVGGANSLPGTVRSPDRFARASFFIEHVPSNVDYKAAAAEVLSVLNNVAVPLGYELEGSPNLSSTQWRSVADSKNLIYYFGLAYQFSVFRIELGSLDLSEGAPVLKIDTTQNTDLHGCVNDVMVKSEPFKPIW